MFPLKSNVPTSRFPAVTVALIAICCLVFVWQQTAPDDTASTPGLAAAGISERDQRSVELGAIPARITSPGTDCAAIRRPADAREAEVAGDQGLVPGRLVCATPATLERAAGAGAPLAPVPTAAWWLTLITSMFMHGGILHLLGNMLFLWVFGPNVEDSMGRTRFVAFYVLAGLVAVYAQALLDTSAAVPTIGASGAVAGVLGGYLLMLPHARVVTLVFVIVFVTIVEVPAALLLGLWFLLQFLPAVGQLGTADPAGGGIAYLAHVGGFLFGMAAIRLFASGWSRVRVPPGPKYPVY